MEQNEQQQEQEIKELEDPEQWENINKIKSEFELTYTKMIDSIDSKVLNELFLIKNKENNAQQTSNANGVVEKCFQCTQETIDEFKAVLVNQLKYKFDNVWKMHNIANNLKIMELLKEKYKNCNKPQWRPYGKTAEQQLIDYRVKMLRKKILHYEKLLEYQKNILEEVFAQDMENNKLAKEMITRREKLLYQIEMQQEKFPILKDKIRELREKIIDLL